MVEIKKYLCLGTYWNLFFRIQFGVLRHMWELKITLTQYFKACCQNVFLVFEDTHCIGMD